MGRPSSFPSLFRLRLCSRSARELVPNCVGFFRKSQLPQRSHVLADADSLSLRVFHRSHAFLLCKAQPVGSGDLLWIFLPAGHRTCRFSALLLPRLGSTLTSKDSF